MDHTHQHQHHTGPAHTGHRHDTESLNQTALVATLHCLLGCAIGEVAGLLIGTALGWSNVATIALAVALAFTSGFALTALPFLRRGYALKAALRIAFAADAASITIMEIVDNAVMTIRHDFVTIFVKGIAEQLRKLALDPNMAEALKEGEREARLRAQLQRERDRLQQAIQDFRRFDMQF